MCGPENTHAHRIGIVDDDDAVRDAIHTLLETQGFLVSEYGSAQEYLRQPQDECALLVDLSMVDFSGLDLVEVLRHGGVDVPIVLMADVSRSWQTSRISAAKDCVTLHKPVDSSTLLTTIAGFLAAPVSVAT
jgi:FixJ family two-component response regulator